MFSSFDLQKCPKMTHFGPQKGVVAYRGFGGFVKTQNLQHPVLHPKWSACRKNGCGGLSVPNYPQVDPIDDP